MAKTISDADKPRYVLYFRGHRPPDEHTRIWVPIYWDRAYAHGVIERFVGDRPSTLHGNTITLTDTPFTITCHELQDILSTDVAPITDEDARTCARFRLGSWEEDHTKKDEVVEVVNGDGTTETVKQPKPPKEAKPAKAGVPDGYVKIGTWCDKWKIKPLHARTCLRASDIPKPEYGWAFPAKDEKKIAKLCGVKL